MEPVTLKARILPRSVFDALLAGGVGLVQLVVLFVVPGAVVAFVAKDQSAGLLTAAGIYVLWALFTVRHLRCDSDGVHFVRTLGSPKRIEWRELDSVEEAPRNELVTRGWLWPLFPAREMTPSLTSTGHYRIRSCGKDTYFPPRDVDAFLEAIRRGRAAQQGVAPMGVGLQSGRV